MPSGRTASATAQTIAPTPPIIPPSAAPFVPFTENGDGVSMCSMAIGIVSFTVGSR